MDQAFRGERAGIPDTPAGPGEAWNTKTRVTASRLKSAGVYKTPRPDNRNSNVYMDEETRAASRILRNTRRMQALHTAMSRVSHYETPPQDELLYEFDMPRNVINGDFLSHVVDEARAMDRQHGHNGHRRQCDLHVASMYYDGLYFGGSARVLPVRTRYGNGLDEYTEHSDAVLPRYPLYGFGPDIVQQKDFCYGRLCNENGHYLTAFSDAGIINVKLMRADKRSAYFEIATLRFVERDSFAAASRLVHACGTSLYRGALYSIKKRKRFGCVVCAPVMDGVISFARHLTLLGFDVLYGHNVFLWPNDCSRHILFTDDPTYLECTTCPIILDPGPDGVPADPGSFDEYRHRWRDNLVRAEYRKWFGHAYVIDSGHNERLHDVFHIMHNTDYSVDPRWDLPAPKPPEHVKLQVNS